MEIVLGESEELFEATLDPELNLIAGEKTITKSDYSVWEPQVSVKKWNEVVIYTRFVQSLKPGDRVICTVRTDIKKFIIIGPAW